MNLDPLDDVLSPLQPPVGGGHGVEHDLAALVDAQPVVGEHRVRPGVERSNETSVETTCTVYWYLKKKPNY